MALLGAAGMGLVWGWLITRFTIELRRPLVTGLTFGLATLAFLAVVLFFADWRAVAVFSVCTGFAFLIHRGWRQELERRSSLPPARGGSG